MAMCDPPPPVGIASCPYQNRYAQSSKQPQPQTPPGDSEFREADCRYCGGLADDAQPCRHCGLGMWGGR